jgi:hypothetical protein
MFESLDGLITPVTRQDAGTFGSCWPDGSEYVPAGTESAPVIVVFGSDNAAKPSQLAACAAGATLKDPIATAAANAMIADVSA